MYITACRETNNETVIEDSDYIDSDYIEATIEHRNNLDDQMASFYKEFLKETEENFEHAFKTALEEPKHKGQFECGKMTFLDSEERLVKTLQTKNKEKDYILCQELECPVCLTEMVPPVKIWTCRYGHTICQTCKRNPNIGRKCPTCRQEIVGRATSLEKIIAALYTKVTGKAAPHENENVMEVDNGDFLEDTASILEMVFFPQSRHGSENLDIEITRLFNNLSMIQTNRS